MELQEVTWAAAQGATAILYLLYGLSVIQLALILERGWRFWRARPPHPGALEAALGDAFGTRDGAAALRRALVAGRSLPERVLATALEHAGRRSGAPEAAVQAVIARERLGLERGLSFLGTVGNNAPFIGLLGTVLGIMTAFADLAAGGGAASRSVMAGISEALVATAVGLMVALPAVAAFNTFQRLLRARTVQAEALAALVQVHAQEQPVDGTVWSRRGEFAA
jgi:biopolymer transport protein ExbB